MNRLMCLAILAVIGLPMGQLTFADQPLDQSKIISVRPALPDAVKAFYAEQKKQEDQQRQQQQREQLKTRLFGWLRKKPPQPPSGKSFWDIFNPAKWGKGNKPAPNTNQQQLQRQLKQSQLPSLNQSTPGNQMGGGQQPASSPPAVPQIQQNHPQQGPR